MRLEKRFGGGFKPFGNQVSIRFVFTERCVYTQGLLHREGLPHSDSFKQRYDFTKGCFYLQVLLHRDNFYREMLVHTGALRYKYFYTEMILLRETFKKQAGCHAGTFTQRCFCTGVFYMLVRLHYTLLSHTFFCARIPLHASTFTLRHFDTQRQTRLHANTVTCGFACVFCMYTHARSHGCL